MAHIYESDVMEDTRQIEGEMKTACAHSLHNIVWKNLDKPHVLYEYILNITRTHAKVEQSERNLHFLFSQWYEILRIPKKIKGGRINRKRERTFENFLILLLFIK